MKVVLTDQVFPTVDVEREILSRIDAQLEVMAGASPEAIRAQANDADALLTTYAAIDSETIASLKKCRVIARYGIGVDNVDLRAAKQAGIVVTNVPDYCVEEVADHTVALIMAIWRKIVIGNEVVRTGRWGIDELRPLHRLRGRKLGMVGFGNIGKAVAARAVAFGLDVAVFDPYVEEAILSVRNIEWFREMNELFSTSDIVSVHAPLTKETRGMINADAVAQMKPGAILVNTSRGPIVDTEAVAKALRAGHLAGAGLDVFAEEPPDAALLPFVPNLVVTPHSAFYSEEAIRESQEKAAECIVSVLRGDNPRYRVI